MTYVLLQGAVLNFPVHKDIEDLNQSLIISQDFNVLSAVHKQPIGYMDLCLPDMAYPKFQKS